MMVIVVGGMIGLGKTTLAELLGKELKTEVFYEKVDDDLVEYYKYIWEGYDEWVATQYNASPILVLNVDMLDWVNNPIDKEIVIGMINDKLNEL